MHSKKCFAHLKRGGILILEPQPLDSYSKKKHTFTPEMKKHLEEIQLKPEEFDRVLQQVGFTSCRLLGMGDADSFSRPLYIVVK